MLKFAKWEGTGNDFILVDDRNGTFPMEDIALVRRLCDRHFGIGSDGLILIQRPNVPGTAFHMAFFNPDGSQSFCGNGSRCAYAYWCGLVNDRSAVRFTAIDGEHAAEWKDGLVRIAMRDVAGIERIDEHSDSIHTGSPHLMVWVDDPEDVEIVPEARTIRYGQRYAKEGINVNFVRWHAGRIEMRTYERGVEGETLSCGTGVTAAALDAMHRGLVERSAEVRTRGGDLRVEAMTTGNGAFHEVFLSGPVKEVFTGAIAIGTA